MNAPREVFEARLAAVQCRESPDVEQLEAEGWTVASDISPWGSCWMTRPVRDEEASDAGR